MNYNKFHEQIVKNRKNKHIYIGSYKKSEITINGKNKKKDHSYIRVKCSYCETEYDITLNGFKVGYKCPFCCNSYENSFAYYIQQDLKEPLNKYWDWEKNELNPYLISRRSDKKVWIKCDKVNYHGNYRIMCKSFSNGSRCGYCNSKKIHPKDSCARWGIDNVDKDFLTKYWSPKNTLNPWELAPRSHKKVWILCQDKEYHNDNGGYLTNCDKFYNDNRCPYCSHKGKYLHYKDSFGYLYPQKAKYWSKNNTKSSFEVTPHSNQKFKFHCEDCNKEFKASPNMIIDNKRSIKCKN